MILKNKKGITLIELIISIALISVVIVFLFRLLADVRYTNSNNDFNRKNQQNRALIIKTVQQDFLDYQLVGATIKNSEIEFKFKNGDTSTLKFESSGEEQTISYTRNLDTEKWVVKKENASSSFNFNCTSYQLINSSGDFFSIRITIPMEVNKEKKNFLDDLEFYYIGEKKDLSDNPFSYDASYTKATC